MKKKGSTDLAIRKIIMMVLLLVVLALVVYGVSTKGLNPLIERAGGMFDEVQLLFGFGEEGGVEGGCVDYFEDVSGIGEARIILCKDSCSIKLENSLSLGNEFNWTSNSLFVKKGSHWDEIWDDIDNLPLTIKERGANKILEESYGTYINYPESSSFMSSGIVPINILVKGNLWGRKYFKWEDGAWFEEKENMWEKGSWGTDIDCLNEIYSNSKGRFGGEVFYRIGTSGAVLRYLYVVGSKEVTPFEDIREGGISYELLGIFNDGRSGKINDADDFELFQDWFSLEKNKIKENQKALDEEMKDFGELLPSESLGEFEGEPYYLYFVRDSDGYGVFYLKTSSESYGLKGVDLKLVKYNSEGGWEVVESSQRLLETLDEEFEEDIKLHKIRKFLERKCG